MRLGLAGVNGVCPASGVSPHYNQHVGTFSDRTVSVLARFLEEYRRAEIAALLMEHGVPGEVAQGNYPNKLTLSMAGLRYLLKQGLVSDFRAILERIYASAEAVADAWERFDAALKADGFAVGKDGKIAEADRDAAEVQDALLVMINRHPEFHQDVLLYHFRESGRLYIDGLWDASIGQCRNLCEQLLADIGEKIAQGRGDSPDLSRPVVVRDYLQSVSFIDETERRRLIDGVYGYLSDEGSHPGISDQTSARVGRLVMLGLAFYLIEKYEGKVAGTGRGGNGGSGAGAGV